MWSPRRSGTELIFDDRGELAADVIADQSQGSLVHPLHDAGAVDHVTRHVHALERTLDIAPHRLQRGYRHRTEF
jgi:hypothetical protein